MAVTGYLGLPAEMANILLRPPTHSVTRSLGSLLFGVPRTHMIALSLDTYSLRAIIIVIYAPTTNATSLICSSLLILRSCWTRKLTWFCNRRRTGPSRCAIREDLVDRRAATIVPGVRKLQLNWWTIDKRRYFIVWTIGRLVYWIEEAIDT